MKNRTGFVSNSSSSSYVVIFGSIFDIAKENGDENIWAKGIDLGEGRDVFELSPSMIAFLKKHILYCESNLELFRVYWMSDPDQITFDKKTLQEIITKMPDNSDCRIEIMEMSHHPTDSVKSLRESYFPNVKDPQDEISKKKEELASIKNSLKSKKSQIAQLESEIKELESESAKE